MKPRAGAEGECGCLPLILGSDVEVITSKGLLESQHQRLGVPQNI